MEMKQNSLALKSHKHRRNAEEVKTERARSFDNDQRRIRIIRNIKGHFNNSENIFQLFYRKTKKKRNINRDSIEADVGTALRFQGIKINE